MSITDPDTETADDREASLPRPRESEELARRYGRTRRVRRRNVYWVLAAVAALVIAFVLWAGFAGLKWFDGGNTNLQATTATYRDIREHSIIVSFGIDATPGSRVACSIQALDSNYTVVGWKVFQYAASSQRSNTHSVTLKTIRESTTGLVDQCWILKADAPRSLQP